MKKHLMLATSLVFAGSTAPVMADMDIHGFATLAIGVADDDHGFFRFDKEPDAQQESLAGIQFNTSVNDKIDATVQFLAEGRNNWDTDLEWAYLTYNMDNGTKLRAGKLRLPIYSYSDYIDVGYARTFLRAPHTVYELVPYTSYSGIDAIVPIELGESTLTIQPFYGSNKDDDGPFGEIEVNNILGVNATWEQGDFSARTVYTQADMDSPVAEALMDIDISFIGASVDYDNGQWFVKAEYASTETDGPALDTDGAYIGAGFRIGEFTPYLIGGTVKTQDDETRVNTLRQIFSYQRNEYSVGVRWDVMPAVAVTADLTFMDNFDHSIGRANIRPGIDMPGEYDEASIFTIALNTVF